MIRPLLIIIFIGFAFVSNWYCTFFGGFMVGLLCIKWLDRPLEKLLDRAEKELNNRVKK